MASCMVSIRLETREVAICKGGNPVSDGTAFPDLKMTLDDIFAEGEIGGVPLERKRHPPGRLVVYRPDQ
jgi:hypothetical protein